MRIKDIKSFILLGGIKDSFMYNLVSEGMAVSRNGNT